MKKYLENLKNNLTLKDRAYNNIKLQIVLGNITSDTKLLEKELSAAMGISRGPIREALNKLEKDGFVESSPRKGFTVTKITPQEIKDIFEEREVLEQFAIKKSFKNIDLIKLKVLENELKEKLLETAKIIDNNKKIQQIHFFLDNKFHVFFVQGCENKKIVEALVNLQDHIHRLQSFVYKRFFFEISTREHLEIIAAVKKKDLEFFCKKLIQHNNSLKNLLLSHINKSCKNFSNVE